MFIVIKANLECSECGSVRFEHFADAEYQGIRCKQCGHEKKELHRHLQETQTGSVSWKQGTNDEPTKF